MIKKGLSLGLTVAVALAIACTRAAPTPGPQAAAPQVAPTPAAPKAPHGGVLRRLWVDPPTLDPALVSDTDSAFIAVEVFSGLVSLDTNIKIVPDIAERWEVSPDGRTYTFYLRKDVKFHDGKPVTAYDFKYSMERAANPATASPVAETYLGDIVGVKEVLEGKATEIKGIKVLDDYTLQITIDQPKAYFLAKLTYPTAFVVDRETVEKLGKTWWLKKANGTGPFKIKEYVVGERLILERNEKYYREPAFLDRVELTLSGGQAMAMYENNEIDITGVGLADLDRVLDPKEPLNKELAVAPPEFSVAYIGFNVKQPPFDDVKVRQAFNHAINKEVIADQVLSGLVVPAYGILPPGFPGYTDKIQGLRFDPEKARQLLAESKYKGPENLPPVILTVPGTGGPGLAVEAIVEMWKQNLGVQVEVQQVEFATFLQDLNRRKLQLFVIGWQADYPDPQDFLDILFHSKSPINHGAYSNPQVDRLLEQARVEQEFSKRVELYNRAEQLIVNDAAWVPLWYQGERYVLIKPYVKDYRLTPMIVPKLRHVYIER